MFIEVGKIKEKIKFSKKVWSIDITAYLGECVDAILIMPLSFPSSGVVRFGAAQLAFPPPKVGQGPALNVLSRSYFQYSSVWVKRCSEKVQRKG